jgi:Leucine-rich repeat (LRR) protein
MIYRFIPFCLIAFNAAYAGTLQSFEYVLCDEQNVVTLVPYETWEEVQLRQNTNRLKDYCAEAIENGTFALSAEQMKQFNGKRFFQIPEEFGQLVNQEELTFSDNSFETIPDLFFSLPNLKKLTITGSNLTTIPDAIKNLNKLTHVDFSHNKFENFPVSLTSLMKLTHINFSHNELSDISWDFEKLCALTEINFDHNKFTNIPQINTDMHQLRKKSVSFLGNPLSSVELFAEEKDFYHFSQDVQVKEKVKKRKRLNFSMELPHAKKADDQKKILKK